MDWFRELLFGRHASAASGPRERADAVREIADQLDQMEPERARFLAAFSYLLGRVAWADREISAQETRAMEDIVEEFGGMSAEEAVLIVRIAKSQNQNFGHIEDFQVSSEFRAVADPVDREKLLHCLFEVAAVDGGIGAKEEAVIRQVSSELDFRQPEFIEVRAAWNHLRSVVRKEDESRR